MIAKYIAIGIVTLLLVETVVRLVPSSSPRVPLFDVEPVASVKATDWYAHWETDHSQLLRHFIAYDIYGLRPFSGTTISIESTGRRKSWNAPNVSSNQATVAFYGGSTMWGGLSRDEYTIPSWVAKKFAAHYPEVSIQVQNEGEVGFVFSQELHRAIRLLYSNEAKPSVMVFFDGVNDTLAALSNYAKGVDMPAGLPWEFEKYEYLFKLGNTGEVTFEDILRKSKFLRMTFGVLENWGIKERLNQKNFWRDPNESDYRRLSGEVARNYIKAIQVADRMVRSVGVIPVFVLQPILAFKKAKSEEEESTWNKNRRWQRLFTIYLP